MCVIRLENIVQDLKYILENGSAKEQNVLYSAYVEIRRFLAEEGVEKYYLYSVNNKDDIISLMNDYQKVNAFFIRDLVAEYENEIEYSEYFEMRGGLYNFVTRNEMVNLIKDNLTQIAVNILTKPFEGVYKQLYNMIVLPMVLNQKFIKVE